MRIEKLLLVQFRNYTEQTVHFSDSCNVICGENAQGKTNLLEAIRYLSCGRSSRTRSDHELIAFGAQEARLCGDVCAREREFHIDITLSTKSKRKMRINDVALKRAQDITGTLDTVLFEPDDLQLIQSGAVVRRRFMDQALCQLRPRYAEALAEYHRLHEHKTRILRDAAEYPSLREALPDFNLRMAQTGAVLIYYRARFCRLLEQYAARMHSECVGGEEKLSLSYHTVKTIDDSFVSHEALVAALMEHQAQHEQAELATRLCLSGPHKDDIHAMINEKDARAFASQGQARTAALSMKLAEREIYREITGEIPVLLLDDVLSELDPKRQEFVLNKISGGQVFITCCEEDRLHSLSCGQVFHVDKGSVF